MRVMPCNLASCYTRGCQENGADAFGGETARAKDSQNAQNMCSRDTKMLLGSKKVLASSGVNMQLLLKAQHWPDVGMHFLLAGLPVSGRGAG